MTTPAVSIVLPTWNGAKLLPDAVKGCLDQTFRNFELIIVNDRSTDDTLAVAERLAASDPRVRVVSNESNLKLPATLNHGFSLARGRYLTWTSDDNRFLPTALERMTCELERTQSDLVYADYDVFAGDGTIVERKKLKDADRLFEYNWVGACFLYRREVRDRLGDYRTDLFCAEDYEYWLRIRTAGLKMTHLPETLYLYADNPQSLTATKQDLIRTRTAQLKLEYADKFPARAASKTKALFRLYRRTRMPELAEAMKRLSPLFARYLILRLKLLGK